jgi:ligand-binding sensor domain-containing protein
VNSDGGSLSPCQTTLFPDVTPTGGTQATDTLQAAVYMSLNPTSNNAVGSSNNLTALYGLQTATPPFVGVATQPTDWTVGILYQGATALSEAQNIAADASGNIWVGTNASGAGGAIAEFSPTGTPMLNTSLGTTTVNGGTAVSLATSSPRNLAIDTKGNIWVTTSSGSGATFEYNPNTAAATAFEFQASYGIAIDGNNNVFIGDQSSSVGTTGNSFIEFLGGNMDPSTEIEFPADEADVQPEYMAVDTAGNVWASSAGVAGTSVVQLSGINTSGCSAFPCSSSTGLASTYTTITSGPINGPWAFAASSSGMWLANPTGNFLTDFALSDLSAANFGSATSLTSPRFPAVDGAGDIWVGNGGTGGLSELASDGTVLSPASTVIGYAHSGLGSGNQVTLDPSGNVWVANNTTGTNANSIFEIVGSGAPTVTPIALSLKNGKVGQKP